MLQLCWHNGSAYYAQNYASIICLGLLETMRAAHQHRMEGETPEARQAHLEVPEARQARLETMRAAHQLRIDREQQREVNPDVPLFEEAAVSSHMRNFHTKLEFYKCSSCFEHFPDLAMSTNRTECARCVRELYSAANNMSLGAVPPQLQVHVCVDYMHCMCYMCN